MDVEYSRCGYGKLIWPDSSSFEGYWINGQACGVGVFRAPAPSPDVYEGFWQQDKTTNLCVFRQTTNPDIFNEAEGLENMSEVTTRDRHNGKGVEVWSDGSYYYGDF